MLITDPSLATRDAYDLVVVGSGFGSLFFVHGYLAQGRPARVLILEWGSMKPHDWQVSNGRNAEADHRDTFEMPGGGVPWNFTIGYGGGSNCWFAQTPRLHPTDFQLATRYGVGRDWPVSYDELEPILPRLRR